LNLEKIITPLGTALAGTARGEAIARPKDTLTSEQPMTTLTDALSTQHRHPPINRPDDRSIVNITPLERSIAGLCGAGLLGFGVTRRTLPSLITGIAGGGALLAMAATGYCPFYDALRINTARTGPAKPSDYYDEGIHVEVNQTIAKSPAEIFRFWRNFENLPKFMDHLKLVTCEGNNRSHWIAKGPARVDVEWDAEIINEEPDRLISWRTVDDSDVDIAGTVRFLPAQNARATEVHVNLDYIPPAGRVGQAVAKIFGEDPKTQIQEDLGRLKQLMETNQISAATTQSQSACR
jgi:uncharacterized membrane protein